MGGLVRDLAEHTSIGVNTSPFIYLWERHSRYMALATELFEHLKSPHVQGVTSMITLIEACDHRKRLGRSDLVQAYERALLRSQQVQTVSVDAGVARRAASLRADYGIRTPDAVQIGAALQAGATAFVTNDRRLAKVQDLRVVVFDDYLE